jgi:hypothetical protein
MTILRAGGKLGPKGFGFAETPGRRVVQLQPAVRHLIKFLAETA